MAKSMAYSVSTLDLIQLMDLIHAAFPLAESGCAPGFRGTHSITRVNPSDPNYTLGSVALNIWWRGRMWPVFLNPVREPHIDVATLVATREEIEKIDRSCRSQDSVFGGAVSSAGTLTGSVREHSTLGAAGTPSTSKST